MNFYNQKFIIALLSFLTILIVVYRMLTIPVQEVEIISQATVVEKYYPGLKSTKPMMNDVCNLRLETGLIVKAVCISKYKVGDKVFVGKIKGQEDKYIIQEFQ